MKNMDCHKAHRLGVRLFWIAVAILPICVLIRKALNIEDTIFSTVCFGLFFCLILFSLYVFQNWCVCPKCGEPLKYGGRILSPIPKRCPNCGKELEEKPKS